MIPILTTLVILCLGLWFSFSVTKITQRLVIPLFYLGAAGLIAYSIYQAVQSTQVAWINVSFYLFKLSVISLGFLVANSFIKWKPLPLIIAFLGVTWIYPNTLPQITPVQIDAQGEYLVELDNALEYDQLLRDLNQFDVTLAKAFTINNAKHPLNHYYVLDIPGHSKRKINKILQNAHYIDAFEENEIIQLSPIIEAPIIVPRKNEFEITDPLYPQQWGLQLMDPMRIRKILHQSSSDPKTKTKLAILDTGVDGSHEDLSDVYLSTREKYDRDNIGHGTHCAGIAAATNDNLIGIASLPGNDLVEVTSIRVLSRFNGSGSQQEIIQGMIEAVDVGAQVISMSLGGRSSDKKKKAYELAVDYADQNNAVIVVAAGNNGGDARNISPANIRGVITVAAIDAERKKAVFSNSVKYIDMGIAAPGVNIMSTIPGNQYKSLNGTSMATPFVASLVAILKAYRPDLNTHEVYSILVNNGVQSQDESETGKIIDPIRSIESILD